VSDYYGAPPHLQPPSQQYGQGLIKPPSHSQAVTSLVLGILSLVLCGIFTGIPAIIMGRRAMREIRASDGRLGGDGIATAGFLTGLIGTIITGGTFLLVVLVFIFGGVINNMFQQTCNSVGAQPHHHQSTC
jgi:hypothetical protein